MVCETDETLFEFIYFSGKADESNFLLAAGFVANSTVEPTVTLCEISVMVFGRQSVRKTGAGIGVTFSLGIKLLYYCFLVISFHYLLRVCLYFDAF